MRHHNVRHDDRHDPYMFGDHEDFGRGALLAQAQRDDDILHMNDTEEEEDDDLDEEDDEDEDEEDGDDQDDDE